MENIKMQAQKGFVRGLVGKEENTSNARLLLSSDPLPNEMEFIKKLYVICWAVIVIGTFIQPGWLFGLFGLLIVYLIDESMTDSKRNRLRAAKFKFSLAIDNNMLFERIQAPLTGKYGMLVQKRADGIVSIEHNSHIYDIIPKEDGTFIIWWRKSLAKAFFSINKKKSYKLILIDMGMIGFEIQNAFKDMIV